MAILLRPGQSRCSSGARNKQSSRRRADGWARGNIVGRSPAVRRISANQRWSSTRQRINSRTLAQRILSSSAGGDAAPHGRDGCSVSQLICPRAVGRVEAYANHILHPKSGRVLQYETISLPSMPSAVPGWEPSSKRQTIGMPSQRIRPNRNRFREFRGKPH